jgi:hypothetical protein
VLNAEADQDLSGRTGSSRPEVPTPSISTDMISTSSVLALALSPKPQSTA